MFLDGKTVLGVFI